MSGSGKGDAINGARCYAAIKKFLLETTEDTVVVPLAELEKMLGRLPKSAKTPQFWANAKDYHKTRRQQRMSAGFNAYYEPKSRSVRFERVASSGHEKAGRLWSAAELRECVSIYHKMWELQQAGSAANKSEMRAGALENTLRGRGPGAFEYRMENVSAVLTDLGIEPVKGYPPMHNIGSTRTPQLIALVNEYWKRGSLVEEPTDDPGKLATRVRSARQRRLAGHLWALPAGSSMPKRRSRTLASFDRLAEVIDYVLGQSAGHCEGCGCMAPFCDDEGEPWLEVHHVRPLAEGGPDQVDNAAALCPNCHRRLHYGSDRKAYRKALIGKIGRLKDYPKVKRIYAG